jgi:hypothetical protein
MKLLLIAGLMACCALAARAERPMVTDDAGTLARGGFKLEAGASRAAGVTALDAAAGVGLLDGLEAELGGARARGGERAIGVALKWVPLQRETGLSVGLKWEAERVRAGGESARSQALLGLLSWRFDNGVAWHNNLGYRRSRDASGREGAASWASGVDLPIAERWQLTAEAFGERGTRPGQQLGLRWRVAEGLAVSAAVGRSDGVRQASAGVAWEFD